MARTSSPAIAPLLEHPQHDAAIARMFDDICGRFGDAESHLPGLSSVEAARLAQLNGCAPRRADLASFGDLELDLG